MQWRDADISFSTSRLGPLICSRSGRTTSAIGNGSHFTRKLFVIKIWTDAQSLEDITDQEDVLDFDDFISLCRNSLAGKEDCTVLDENNQPLRIDECSEGAQSATPPPYNFDDVLYVDPSPQATSALGEKLDERSIIINEDTDEDVNEDIAQKTEGNSEQMNDVNVMVKNNETTINKEEKNECELVAVDDVKLNDDVDDDEADETEDISCLLQKHNHQVGRRGCGIRFRA